MEESLLYWYIDNFNNVEFRQTYGLTELGILKIKNESPVCISLLGEILSIK